MTALWPAQAWSMVSSSPALSPNVLANPMPSLASDARAVALLKASHDLLLSSISSSEGCAVPMLPIKFSSSVAALCIVATSCSNHGNGGWREFCFNRVLHDSARPMFHKENDSRMRSILAGCKYTMAMGLGAVLVHCHLCDRLWYSVHLHCLSSLATRAASAPAPSPEYRHLAPLAPACIKYTAPPINRR